MEIATKDSWKIEPISEQNEKIDLNIKLTSDELEKLKKGHIPTEMEDHWFMYYDNNKLYCHRSWTGICIFVVDVLDNGEIHHAVVTRDSTKYTCNNILKDMYLLESLIYKLVDRFEEARSSFEKYIKC